MTNSRALSILTGLLALTAFAQQQVPERGEVVVSSSSYRPPALNKFEADTRLVEVGVVVRDPRGHSVPGFTKDDFEIADEGRKRQITTFLVEASAPPSAEAPATPANSTPDSPPAAVASQRYVALIFDDLSMPHGELVAAQSAALRFVKEFNV
jgi:VWFA-related protein